MTFLRELEENEYLGRDILEIGLLLVCGSDGAMHSLVNFGPEVSRNTLPTNIIKQVLVGVYFWKVPILVI